MAEITNIVGSIGGAIAILTAIFSVVYLRRQTLLMASQVDKEIEIKITRDLERRRCRHKAQNIFESTTERCSQPDETRIQSSTRRDQSDPERQSSCRPQGYHGGYLTPIG